MSDLIYVARNLRADYETQTLGEDHPVIKSIVESFTLFRQSIEAARFLVRSKDAVEMLRDLDVFLVDADHETCLSSVARRAAEAFEEAKVVPIRRPGAPTLTVVPK